ncbi:polysaccharide deacetylase family protein [Roseobacter sp.]|uniref:polysaccharide deacetylase family protein n=1 Tax=Roseobacter sp. TaxID=1907202 RepID=UPI0032975FA3
MTADWSPLRRELALWRADRATLPLWWRDDDAIAATPALAQLHDLVHDIGLPVHIAVIPALADQTLADAVADTPLFLPTVHGWAHENRAPNGQKKAEFGALHPDTPAQLHGGMAKLRGLFGDALLPVFVAPWNRLHPNILPHLVSAGHRIVSTFQPRPCRHPVAGLMAVNTHIDPIDWRGTRGLKPPAEIIAETVHQLAARRCGDTDATEPFGYLTHHLVHNVDIWSFSRRFLIELLEGGATSTPLTHTLKETS